MKSKYFQKICGEVELFMDKKKLGLSIHSVVYAILMLGYLSGGPTPRAADGANGVASIGCEDCGLPYGEFPLDMTLPDDQWLAIHPSGEGGLLCAQCIVARASKLKNVIAVRAIIEIDTPRR